MHSEDDNLQQCRSLIEEKLGWGAGQQWQNGDFEALSERIFAETGVSLSVSTLKRIWGKVRYDSAPTATTLNTLAQFVGYQNWRSFRQPAPAVHTVEPVRSAPEPPVRVAPNRLPASRWPWVIGLLFVAGLVGIWAFQNRVKPLEYGAISFSSRPVTRGLPNTVLFDYDAGDSNADSVFIQQSWNPKLRFRVEKGGHHYASTYYYPGYFRAKLVMNDSIVKEHDLYITTDGWLGTINYDSIPVYFPHQQIYRHKTVALTEADLSGQGINLQQTVPSVSLHYVQPLGDVSGRNFVFETELKSTFNRNEAVCQQTGIMLLCSNGMHFIPLSVKGCVGQLTLSFAGTSVSGKTNDLSGFGVDFSDWVRMRCEVKDKRVTVLVNGQRAYEGPVDGNPGKIVGVRYYFQGTGAIKSARISDGKTRTVLL
ncbi:hypothetical protein LX87_01727 [Larkinella arboricola]|uniref:Uncharacterized protein n=1 Tax=Larkinella arboricola TaxID=643671 RepID=A0A327X1N2_LARAB|nr:hypothetical protein [Larkinella arboricola]RAK00030.1 hypothetical protein LX87_01727 [Larkinella arboricola]